MIDNQFEFKEEKCGRVCSFNHFLGVETRKQNDFKFNHARTHIVHFIVDVFILILILILWIKF